MSPKVINELKSKWNQIENSKISRFLLYISLAFIMVVTMISNVIPEKLDISLNSIAEEDIHSPYRVTNPRETNAKEAQAAASVPDEYVEKENVVLDQVVYIEKLFNQILELQSENSKGETGKDPAKDEDTPANNDKSNTTAKQQITELRNGLPEFISKDISDDSLITFLNASKADISMAKDVASSTIKAVMDDKITVEQINEKKKDVQPFIENAFISDSVKPALTDITGSAITSNYTFDAEATKKLREEAVANTEPVWIREGETIVEKGSQITSDDLYKLELVGLLKESFSPYPYIGLGILVLLITSFLIYFLRDLIGEKKKENIKLIIYVLMFSITLILMKITSLLSIYYPSVAFIVPVALGTMMIKMLIDEQTAIISSIVFAICGSLIFNDNAASPFNFAMGTYVLISSLAGVLFLGKRNVKSKILKTGFFVSMINSIVVLLILSLTNGKFELLSLSWQVGYALFSGFLSAVLTLGLLPFFEAGFGILTTIKLVELSSPNHPLLRKLLMETPGTYHHSVVVANLAEAACESIGANGLLARVGSYYHDLGKTKRPHFFIENQMNIENPHDKISPQLSKTIIIAHPYDGAEMLAEYNLPTEIIDIAEQHHGTTLLKYFYHKAVQQSDKQIEESDFRYPGPKPQTKEIAIISISDSVEAAVRSIAKPTPIKIESLVRKIVADRLEDGQFNECSITLKELETVTVSICETLNGMFHSRIEYPEEIHKKKVSQA
ncbi:HD family phosphohydrolase [Pseudalkalibacillus salsuginis]|uniref:HD family phosphohydrolase n=1 Tax=Pseudalkalibacillus salsuginis TaxID=2910972 RepID=UPI001F1E3962|nr:HD family phosphohydrolase [Pseudalkalibacillus salsuginis]MCF6408529.1 HD family phosphohydrolase [Pseudalkalibacillus salsuginis]